MRDFFSCMQGYTNICVLSVNQKTGCGDENVAVDCWNLRCLSGFAGAYTAAIRFKNLTGVAEPRMVEEAKNRGTGARNKV